MKRIIKIIVITFVIIIIVLVGLFFLRNRKELNSNNVIVNDYTVEFGTITSTISGKATVQPNDQYTVTSMVSGDVLASYFEEGDIIEKDTVMYEIDSSDISKSIESSNLNLEKAKISLDTTNDSINDLTMYAQYSGIVRNLVVKEGDNINNGQVIAEVYNEDYLLVKIPFNENNIKNISVGNTAIVSLGDTDEDIKGIVTSISSTSYALSGYMRVVDVEIKIKNPGSVQVGSKATAIINDIACNSAGVFEYFVEENLKATASGKISKLYLKDDKMVSKGDIMIVLDSDILDTQKRNNEISIREAELSKERTLDSLDDYTIKAPITGTVITKEVKVGDKLDNTTGSKVLAIIYDLSSLKFDIEIDELDVASIQVGQEVTITADAVSNRTYIGYVEKININGTSSNGVTVYPVTVRINEFDGLLPGMNIDAEIAIEKVENVIVIPSECVNRGNIVYVRGAKVDENDNAPEGYKSVKVETGLADSSNIEIKSGLSLGDTIRGREINTNNKIMERMEEMHDSMSSGEIPSGGMMRGGGDMPGGMR